MGPAFGDGDIVPELVQTNPADRLFTSGLQPGQLAIYANYGGRDNFNFDAQDRVVRMGCRHPGESP